MALYELNVANRSTSNLNFNLNYYGSGMQTPMFVKGFVRPVQVSEKFQTDSRGLVELYRKFAVAGEVSPVWLAGVMYIELCEAKRRGVLKTVVSEVVHKVDGILIGEDYSDPDLVQNLKWLLANAAIAFTIDSKPSDINWSI